MKGNSDSMNSNNVTKMTVSEAIEHLTWYKNTHLSGFGKTYWAITVLIAAVRQKGWVYDGTKNRGR